MKGCWWWASAVCSLNIVNTLVTKVPADWHNKKPLSYLHIKDNGQAISPLGLFQGMG
jgi:hypothetical protein